MDKNKALELAIDYDAASLDSERWADRKERVQQGLDYYAGIQTWTDQQKTDLANAGKPCLTFNLILPIINNLTGDERDNRKDIRVEKYKGGFEAVAALYTQVAKHVMDQCDGDYVKSNVFENGIKTGIGWFKLEIDGRKDPVNGQIILRSRSPLSVREDPCSLSYNLNDSDGAAFVVDTEWLGREYLQSLYPDKKSDIEGAIEDYVGSRGKGGLVSRLVNYVAGSTVLAADEDELLFDRDLANRWRCRRTETWFKEWVTRTMVVDLRSWDVWWLDPKKKADYQRIQLAKQLADRWPKLYSVKEKQPLAILHMVRRIGDLLLEHVEDPFNGMNMFPLIPFCPFGEEQSEFGLIDNLISPQDEINKRVTAATHLLAQGPNGGLKVKKLDPGYRDVLREFGSSPDFVFEVDKCGGMLEKIPPNYPPVGLMDLVGAERNFMEEISNVTGSKRGLDPQRQESGVLYREKVRQSIKGNQVVFDRFDLSTQIMANTMVDMIRRTDTYSQDEIFQLIDDKDIIDDELMDEARQEIMKQSPPPRQPDKMMMMQLSPEDQQMVMGQFASQMDQYQAWADPQAVELVKNKLYEKFKSYRTGRYGVLVIQSPHAATTQMGNFLELSSLREYLPPEVLAAPLIRSTSLPKTMKDDILKKMEPAMGPM